MNGGCTGKNSPVVGRRAIVLPALQTLPKRERSAVYEGLPLEPVFSRSTGFTPPCSPRVAARVKGPLGAPVNLRPDRLLLLLDGEPAGPAYAAPSNGEASPPEEKAVQAAATEAASTSESEHEVVVATAEPVTADAAAALKLQRWLRQRQTARRMERAEAAYHALALVRAKTIATPALGGGPLRPLRSRLRAATAVSRDLLKVKAPPHQKPRTQNAA